MVESMNDYTTTDLYRYKIKRDVTLWKTPRFIERIRLYQKQKFNA